MQWNKRGGGSGGKWVGYLAFCQFSLSPSRNFTRFQFISFRSGELSTRKAGFSSRNRNYEQIIGSESSPSHPPIWWAMLLITAVKQWDYPYMPVGYHANYLKYIYRYHGICYQNLKSFFISQGRKQNANEIIYQKFISRSAKCNFSLPRNSFSQVFTTKKVFFFSRFFFLTPVKSI